jgi:hypothetical protein
MSYVPPTPTLKAWAIMLGGEYAGNEVATTAGKAKAAAYREARSYDSGLEFTDLSVRLVRGEKGQMLIERHEDRGKYWRDTRSYARMQARVDEFNAKYPVGHPVRVVECGEADQWPDGLTTIRTPAWVASENTILVSVEGQAGGMYFKYVQPIEC